MTIDMTDTYIQIDPAEDGDPLTLRARFSRTNDSRWNSWTTVISSRIGMGFDRDPLPANEGGNAIFTIPYNGPLPAGNLRVELSIEIDVSRTGAIDNTFHVQA